MNELGENNEVRMLKLRAAYLKNQCAEEVERYTALITHEGKGIEAEYMLKLGSLEGWLMRVRIDLMRWHRRLELRQKALNRGEVPNLVEIETKVDAELAVYQKELQERAEAVKRAKALFNAEGLTDEEVDAIRMNYLKAAKQLHPDLNPNLPKDAAALWLKINETYKEKDWKQLSFLVGMVEDVVKGVRVVESAANGIEELKARIAALEKKRAELVAKREILMKDKPYCYAAILEHDDEVELRRAALKAEIEKVEDDIADCEREWAAGKEAA